MHAHFCVRAACLALGLLICTTVSYSQPAPNPAPSPTPQQVIYTGKLLGYFRVPSLQAGDAPPGCQGRSSSDDSVAATTFLSERDKFSNAILLGAGDNFAPQLEARIFFPAPRATDSGRHPEKYAPGNKELYNWGGLTSGKPGGQPGNRWIFYESDNPAVEERIKRGVATIPTDNVGCFLAAARFTALVPGKHDFYFGAERLRQLARFMAGLELPGRPHPPQMLGANLVRKTTRMEGGALERPATPKTQWLSESGFNFREGKLLYPWFSSFRRLIGQVRTNELLGELKGWFLVHKGTVTPKDLSDVVKRLQGGPGFSEEAQTELREIDKVLTAFSRYSISVCGADDKSSSPSKVGCTPFSESEVRLEGSALVFLSSVRADAAAHKGKNGHFSTVSAGKDHRLCVSVDETAEKYCPRFSVYTPFFTFPHDVATKQDGLIDPDPFVFLPNAFADKEVAIFGVVDPKLGEQVGVLNFSWLNEEKEFKTVISIEDPAEALRQQLDYFEQKYKAEHHQQRFTGLKILLAQMSPQLARVFAARFPEFQLVVTEADDDQATVDVTQETTWTTKDRKGTLVAVPSKSFDDITENPRVALGLITVSQSAEKSGTPTTSWVLAGDAQSVKIANEPRGPKAVDKVFGQRMRDALARCGPPSQFEKAADSVNVKWLTLCAMRERTGADIALLQKRDFFRYRLAGEIKADEFQQTLDRIIWKGDLLTLLFVPGGAIRKALDQSTKFDTDDANILSLADTSNRGLETLGVDSKGGQYFINEMPLDDKKIYTVATTDYIGAGDTGYPDFKGAALNPKTVAPQFPEKLDIISGVVCRTLFENKGDVDKYCLPVLQRTSYLDHLSTEGPLPPKKPGLARTLWNLVPFRIPPPDPAVSIEQVVQRRPIWTFALRNFSLGFSGLTKNLSDADIAAKFSGVAAPGVTARKTSSITAQIDTRLSRSSHANEFFVGVGADFKEQSTGDVSPQIVQINNRATGDAGVIHALRGGRSQTRLGVALYVHFESPLQKPFSTFTLNAQDRLKITQSRNVSILPRLGLRWLNRGNSFEAGFQAGREINAFTGYQFSTNGNIALCTPSSTETFAACVNRLIKAGTVTKDSAVSVLLANRPRAGLYSRVNLTIPITAKAKYVFSEEGDLFLNFHGDTPIDTRFRDISNHSLKFVVWPSLSIGPTLRLLLYQNKVNGDFLFQKQFGFETTLSFDLFNRRERGVQLRHKP